MPESRPQTFAQLLKQLRTRAGLTQEELAHASDVSARSISDLERGIAQKPHGNTIRLLSDALGLTNSARTAFERTARGQPLARPSAPAGATLRALPRDIASFTGREPELRALLDAAEGRDAQGGVAAIYAIEGMAGIGKTAFAIHAAHQLAPRFPGGQIFLPLHGHTPGRRPEGPADALASLLQAAGVPAERVPQSLEGRTVLWRDTVAAQAPLLLILDDAVDSEQVELLLPGAAGSMVLVTSRRRLTTLNSEKSLAMSTLAPAEAARLVIRLADRPDLSAQDPAVGGIALMCGYLPLAIAMMAGQLRHHPTWTPADLAEDLAEARDRLALMTSENVSVAAAFDLSYADLPPDVKRLFRRMGLHPGSEIDGYAAAALDNTDLASADHRLQSLYDQYLLVELTRGRYQMHDLIRGHARALAGRDEPRKERNRALDRLVGYYLQAGAAADQQLARYIRPAEPSPAPPRTAVLPPLEDSEAALEWASTERGNLAACLDLATQDGQLARIVGLAASLSALFRHYGPWAEGIDRHAVAAAAARDLGDRLAEANALCDLASLQFLTGDSAAAIGTLGQALDIYQILGHQRGQANTLSQVANVQRATGDYSAAADAVTRALGYFEELGDQRGLATTLNELGGLRYLISDFPGAAEALEQALGICRELGDLRGQASVLNNLGNVQRLTGDYRGAARVLEEALASYRDLRDREGQADVLNLLGVVRRLTGDYPGAADALEEALAMYRDLGSAQGQANSLSFLGTLKRVTGDLDGSAVLVRRALAMYRDVGDRGGEVEAVNEMGARCRDRGDLKHAAEWYQRALALARAIRSPWDEAQALAGLARCARAEGRVNDGSSGFRQALGIFRRIGAAGEVRLISAEIAELAELTAAEPPGS